jgi:anti-sigma B factor antagonist
MKITREDQSGGAVILRLAGELMGGPETEDILEAVRLALRDGRRHVIVDLEHVPWMSSGGIGILTRIHTRLRNDHGRLSILHASERVKKILIVTGLIAVFETFNDEESALASFGG